MGGEQRIETAGLAEQHVRHLLFVRHLQVEPSASTAIFFSAPAMPSVWRVNCTAEASASDSRERATAGLDQARKEIADVADHDQRQPDHPYLPTAAIAPAAAAAAKPDHAASHDRQHQDAEQQAHQVGC